MADVELDELRQARDRPRRLAVEPMPGVALDALARCLACGERQALEFVRGARSLSPCASVSHQAPVCSSTTGAPIERAAATACTVGSMNSETRMPTLASSAVARFR